MAREEENPDSENSEARYFKEKDCLKTLPKANHPDSSQSG
jgi:hypothetical protein